MESQKSFNTFIRPHHSENICATIIEQFRDRKYCDVEIEVQMNERISAHRIILAASSPFFNLKLDQLNGNILKIPVISATAIRRLIEYCYTGRIMFEIKTISLLLKACQMMEFIDVETAGWEFVLENLRPDNCLRFEQLALECKNSDSLRRIKEYICEKFLDVIKTTDFLRMSKERLAQLLWNDFLYVSSEKDVFLAVMKWIQFDINERMKFFPGYMAVVRLGLLDPSFLIQDVRKACILYGYPYLLDEFQAMHNKGKSSVQHRRSRYGKLIAISGTSCNSNERYYTSIECYCVLSKRWTRVKYLPFRRTRCSVAQIDNVMFVLGGLDENYMITNTMHSVDLSVMAVSNKPAMRVSRCDFGVAVVDHVLYVIGGTGDPDCLSSMECFDPSKGSGWSILEPMQHKRAFFGIALLDQKIYVVGGRDKFKMHDSVECYDPRRNLWLPKSNMKESRACLGLAALNGFLYAVGGFSYSWVENKYTRSNTIEKYCPKTDEWTMETTLSSPRSNCSVEVLGDCLVVVGGYSRASLNLVETYNPTTKVWTKLASLETPRTNLGLLFTRSYICKRNSENSEQKRAIAV